MMEEERDLAGFASIENPPSFHTVRSLTISLAKKAKESKEAIQKNNVHKSVDTQLIYQEGMIYPSIMLRFSLLLSKLGEILRRLVGANKNSRGLCPVNVYYG